MSERNKENPRTPKRSKRKPAMEPLGWDEIVSQPGMGGYLSFLNGPVPLPHLQSVPPEVHTDPGVVSASGSGPDIVVADADVISTAVAKTTPEVVTTLGRPEVPPQAKSLPHSTTPEVDLPADVCMGPGIMTAPVVVSTPVFQAAPRLRIRKCATAQDGHSLGEEVLYQALWKAASAETTETRTIVIGWRGMSQLCRMTPKNCKINTQRLIRKCAVEVLSPYNTPESIGTTYRLYSDDAILRRRRERGLEWVVRSRGVEFVDPATGAGLNGTRELWTSG